VSIVKYDSLNRPTEKRNPIELDGSGNFIYSIEKYAYDEVGNLKKQTMLTEKLCVSASGSVGIEYGYDAAGNRISMQDESGSYTYKHDGNNRITEVRKNSAVQLIYTYDETGNIETVTDSEGFVTGYTYDKSGRMETVTFDGRTTIYAYDLSGNRESVTYEGGVKEEYTYNRNNRLLTLTNKKPNGAIISKYSYTYDIIGNETSKTDNYGTTYYTYDKAGRDTKVETPGKTTLYTYDNAGNRQSLVETYTSNQSSGNGDGGGDNGNESNKPVFSYFLFNGHGDTVQTVTQEGEIQNQYDYVIFGSPTLTIETAACSIRYAGEYLDNETGLYYLRARYYNPYIGRFISEDSYWGEDDNPLSLNLYTYCSNNPIRYTDPTGHWQEGDETLSASAQNILVELTNAYYEAKTPEQREQLM
jgi:RHS repeat-associated protein